MWQTFVHALPLLDGSSTAQAVSAFGGGIGGSKPMPSPLAVTDAGGKSDAHALLQSDSRNLSPAYSAPKNRKSAQ